MSPQHSQLRVHRVGYKEIAAKMRDRIEAGTLPVGRYLPTERELQEQFSASRSTIRKALALLVEDGFGQSVPNRGVIAARVHAGPKTRKIALIDKGNYVLRVLTLHLSELLHAQGYEPVHIGGRRDYPLEYALQHAVDNDFAGAIVWSYKAFADLDFLKNAENRFPVIALDHSMEGVETDLVTFDHQRAAYDATVQLIKQGCKRIGVTACSTCSTSHTSVSGAT